MTEDEYDDDQEEDGGVVPILGAALAIVDGGEHPYVEEEEEGEGDEAEKNKSEEKNQSDERWIVLSENR